MTCPSPQEINMFEDHELDRHRREELAGHLQICPVCSRILAEIKAMKTLMDKRAKENEPRFIPAFKPKPLEMSRPKSYWIPRPAIAVSCLILLIVGGFWIFGPKDSREFSTPDITTAKQMVPEILKTTIKGERADTMIFNDPENKTTFVWAVQKPKK
jgi:hypothetical protein